MSIDGIVHDLGHVLGHAPALGDFEAQLIGIEKDPSPNLGGRFSFSHQLVHNRRRIKGPDGLLAAIEPNAKTALRTISATLPKC